MRFWNLYLSLIAVATLLIGTSAADQLTLSIGGKPVQLNGEILIEAKDESLFFQGIDGRIWFVKPEQVLEKQNDDKPVEAITKKELGDRLLEELPPGFRIYETKHYVIAYQNEAAYARWVGGLYESRLYRAFETFWKKKKKFDLEAPRFPLVAIIFGTRAEYQRYVDQELGPGQNMIAYYNLETNRVTMFDLTAAQRNPNQPLDDRKIDAVLQNPASVNMVATMIHEATHQLMFNRGVQTRFAETPLWLNEGLAMFFEAPDLGSKRGWQKPGLIFEQRLIRFRKFLASRPADSLQNMIMSDQRLRDPEAAIDAYAEAWAFNHFLLNRRSQEYVAYLAEMSTKKPLIEDSPETRLADFKKFLGDDLNALDQEFVEYVLRLK